ncbi:IS3 family transposase [Escherichia coli]|uniref:IS3 family transposase n=1 Tax=Escherichia coli TaxID=562 RepID=UPI000BB7CB6C
MSESDLYASCLTVQLFGVSTHIEYYNSRRISLKLKGLTPIEYRNQTYMPRV